MKDKVKKVIVLSAKTFLVFFLVVVVLVSHSGIAHFIPAVAPQVAHAAFNAQINYQGKLTNASNVAVPDGTYHMKFWLLTSPTAATTTAIWTEDRSTIAGNRVTVTDGLFSVMLGSSTPLTSVDFNQTLYLGVEVGGSGGSPSWDGEMSPRKVLGAVPAAFEADRLDGVSSEQFFRNDITNATSSATTSLSVAQYGAGKIAEFFGVGGLSAFSVLSTGNVGVGTSSPFSTLSVQTTSSDGTTSLFAVASSTNATLFNVLGNGNVGIGSTSPFARLSVRGAGTTDGINFQTTNSSNNPLFTILDSGNVGIGTTTPQYLLDVDTSLSALGGFINNYRPLISAGSIGDEVGLITNYDNYIAAYITGTDKYLYGGTGVGGLVVGGYDGYVGIGTTTPEYSLDVWGSGAVFGDPGSDTARAYVGANNDSIAAGNEAGIWSLDTESVANQIAIYDNNKSFQYGGTLNSPGIYIGGGESTNPLGVGIQTITPGSVFSVNGNVAIGSSYKSLTTVPSNSLAVEGSLGVGIAVPTSKLHVVGGSAWIQNAGAVSLTLNDSSNSQIPNISLRQNSTQKAFIQGGVGLNSRLDLGTGVSTVVVTVLNTSVGISETAPGSKLSVSGNGSYGTTYDTVAAPTNGLIVEGNVGVGTSSPFSKLSVQTTSSAGTTSLFAVASSTNATLFNVLGNGNVGVGTATPFSTLSVQATSSAGTTSVFAIASSTNATLFNVLGNGNVGVGTATPISTLSVQGSLCVRNTGSCGTTAGTIYATTATVQGIDLAENYQTTDSTLIAAEIVTVDRDNSTFIKRASRGDTVIGIVSTAPGFLLGSNIGSSRPVALAGRVPLRVNDEGGEISIGDRIAVSSIPGVGMKGSFNDQTIAVALESFNGNTGIIEVFVDRQKGAENQLVIGGAGNVGVGIDSPVYKIQAGGDIGAHGFAINIDGSRISNINKLKEEDLVAFASKLNEIDISTFKFSYDAGTTTRLGILSDDAPSEILTAGGDIDVYRLSVFTLGAVKADQLRLDTLEERLAAVEAKVLAEGEGSLWANPMQIFKSFGISISESLAQFKDVLVAGLTVGSAEKPTGITLYDEVTGKPYCVKIVKSKLKNFAGECGQNSSEEILDDDHDNDSASSAPAGSDTSGVIIPGPDSVDVSGAGGARDLIIDAKDPARIDAPGDTDKYTKTKAEPSNDDNDDNNNNEDGADDADGSASSVDSGASGNSGDSTQP